MRKGQEKVGYRKSGKQEFKRWHIYIIKEYKLNCELDPEKGDRFTSLPHTPLFSVHRVQRVFSMHRKCYSQAICTLTNRLNLMRFYNIK